jgi:hypothetical protein
MPKTQRPTLTQRNIADIPKNETKVNAEAATTGGHT